MLTPISFLMSRCCCLSWIRVARLSAGSLLCGLGGLQASTTVDFPIQVRPLMERYCVECHNPEDRKAGFDLEPFRHESDFLAEPGVLEDLEYVLWDKSMPPQAHASTQRGGARASAGLG